MAEPIDASAVRTMDVIFIVGITGGNLTDSHEIGVGTHKDDVARAHLVTKFPIPKSRLGGYGVSVRSNAFRLQGLNDFVLIRKSRNIPKWWGHGNESLVAVALPMLTVFTLNVIARMHEPVFSR